MTTPPHPRLNDPLAPPIASPSDATAGKARFDRDGPPSAGGVEKRVDPSDGCSYTRQEFEDFYRGAWQARWASAKPPTGNEDKRKLSALLFLNERPVAGGQVRCHHHSPVPSSPIPYASCLTLPVLAGTTSGHRIHLRRRGLYLPRSGAPAYG